MKIEAPTRILSEDYPEEYQELVDKLADSLNTYLDSVYNAFSGSITIDDNINQVINTFKVTVDSSGNPVNKLQFKSNINGKTQGLQVIRSFGDYYVEAHPFIDFVDRDGTIEINNIRGLQGNVEYTLVIHVIGS